MGRKLMTNEYSFFVGTDYEVAFYLEGEVTFCNIIDLETDFVIAAGHSIPGPRDSYDLVEGMKHSLARTLKTEPIDLFDKEDRKAIWEVFWVGEDSVEEDRLTSLEARIEELEELLS